MRASASTALVDRHVPQAPPVERLSGPAAVPLAQPEPGEAGHEVELARPDVAQGERAEADPVGADADVRLVHALGGPVEAPDLQPDAVRTDAARVDVLVDAVPVLPQAVHRV